MNEEQFIEALKEKGISLSDHQLQQFNKYFHMLVEWNEKMNLTAITDAPSVYLKHFYDSISAAFYTDMAGQKSICDVGAGAGFPSIPLKICFPDLAVTIVDSLNKRITFLTELAKELELDNVRFHSFKSRGLSVKIRNSVSNLILLRLVLLPVYLFFQNYAFPL